MPKGKRNIPRPRNGGTWSESQYFAAVRSALRRKFMFYVPLRAAKMAARRPYVGPNKLQKWESQCHECRQWHKEKDVQVDHVVSCGTLRCYEDIVPFLKRLTCEEQSGYRVMCKKCHQDRTNEERAAAKTV